jgi:hypothetical protein
MTDQKDYEQLKAEYQARKKRRHNYKALKLAIIIASFWGVCYVCGVKLKVRHGYLCARHTVEDGVRLEEQLKTRGFR